MGFLLGPLIIYFGLRIAIAKNFIWIPKRFLSKNIPSYFLVKIINRFLSLLKFTKRWSRPRYEWSARHETTRVVNGIIIALIGLAFTLCPPVPFTSLIAFLSICLIAIGMMNDDGIYIIAGYVCSCLYFIVTIFLFNYCSLRQMIGWTKCLYSYYAT